MNIFQQREQILANLIEAYKEHDEEKTDNLLDQLFQLDQPEEKLLPKEPKATGFYATANNGRLLCRSSDGEWSARTYGNAAISGFWNDGDTYTDWDNVCATFSPDAFPLRRLTIEEPETF